MPRSSKDTGGPLARNGSKWFKHVSAGYPGGPANEAYRRPAEILPIESGTGIYRVVVLDDSTAKEDHQRVRRVVPSPTRTSRIDK